MLVDLLASILGIVTCYVLMILFGGGEIMAALDYQACVIGKYGTRFKQSFETLNDAIDYAESFDEQAYLVIYKPTGVPVAYRGNDHIRDNQAFMSFFV